MKDNIGVIDRRARIVIGVGLALIGVTTLGGLLGFSTVVGIVLTLIGLILVGTGAVGMCPVYRILGISTSNAP
jgi:hypothetical protein